MDDSADLLGLLDGAVEQAAPRLLGGVLRHGAVAVRITEVEAYAGPADPGSHAYRGPTPRTAVMFGDPGRLYTYLSYGVHVCANVVTGPPGQASAVLLRAGEVLEGLDLARARRPGVRDRDLARGPALLCRALGITLAHGGGNLTSGAIRLTATSDPVTVSVGPRVGLRLAPERPWRFWITADPTVSAYRRHPKAVVPGSGGPD